MKQDERAAFEVWAVKERGFPVDRDEDGCYEWGDVIDAWEIWQAARAGIAASAEPSINRYQSTDSTDNDYDDAAAERHFERMTNANGEEPLNLEARNNDPK